MLHSATHASIEAIVSNRLVTSLYQPILDIDTREVIAYEALARGPEGSGLEDPAELFAAADQAGLRTELDWECRAAAMRGAMAAGLGQEVCLFVNVEPSSFGTRAPAHLVDEIEAATSELRVIAEITEQDLDRDPALLLQGLAELRALGIGVAIDNFGSNPETLALLPFLEPDVVKLDMSLVQSETDELVAATAAAIRADAERRGTKIVAEGIETDEHLQRADVLGATHAQGWFFGHPAPLPAPDKRSNHLSAFWDNLSRDFHPGPETPWAMVSGSIDLRVTTKELLLPMSMLIEQYPIVAHERRVVLAAFQHARNFTGATTRRYTELAKQATFIGVLGEDLSEEPVPGVRGGHIEPGHPLCGEWTVISVGPHYAAALIAKDLDDDGPESERRFLYTITHNREKVITAAKALLRLIQPIQGEAALSDADLRTSLLGHSVVDPKRRSTDTA